MLSKNKKNSKKKENSRKRKERLPRSICNSNIGNKSSKSSNICYEAGVKVVNRRKITHPPNDE